MAFISLISIGFLIYLLEVIMILRGRAPAEYGPIDRSH